MAFAIHPSPVGSHTTGRERVGVGLGKRLSACGQPYYWAGKGGGWADTRPRGCGAAILLGGNGWGLPHRHNTTGRERVWGLGV